MWSFATCIHCIVGLATSTSLKTSHFSAGKALSLLPSRIFRELLFVLLGNSTQTFYCHLMKAPYSRKSLLLLSIPCPPKPLGINIFRDPIWFNSCRTCLFAPYFTKCSYLYFHCADSNILVLLLLWPNTILLCTGGRPSLWWAFLSTCWLLWVVLQ